MGQSRSVVVGEERKAFEHLGEALGVLLMPSLTDAVAYAVVRSDSKSLRITIRRSIKRRFVIRSITICRSTIRFLCLHITSSQEIIRDELENRKRCKTLDEFENVRGSFRRKNLGR